jgi:hypothetical protein
MSATASVRIAPISVRIENIDFADFLGALSKIVQERELDDTRPQALTLFSAKRGRYIQIQAVAIAPQATALTVTCDDPDLLELFIKSVNRLYGKEAAT